MPMLRRRDGRPLGLWVFIFALSVSLITLLFNICNFLILQKSWCKIDRPVLLPLTNTDNGRPSERVWLALPTSPRNVQETMGTLPPPPVSRDPCRHLHLPETRLRWTLPRLDAWLGLLRMTERWGLTITSRPSGGRPPVCVKGSRSTL